MILKTTLLDTIANSIGYTVRKQSGYYMVARPNCRTGTQCDTLQDVAEHLASMIKEVHKNFKACRRMLNEKQTELESISEAHKEPSDSPEYWDAAKYTNVIPRSFEENFKSWSSQDVDHTKFDEYSNTDITMFWNNARLTSLCIGHKKGERNLGLMKVYEAELKKRGMDKPVVLPEDGEFVKYNGRGSA